MRDVTVLPEGMTRPGDRQHHDPDSLLQTHHGMVFCVLCVMLLVLQKDAACPGDCPIMTLIRPSRHIVASLSCMVCVILLFCCRQVWRPTGFVKTMTPLPTPTHHGVLSCTVHDLVNDLVTFVDRYGEPQGLARP